MKFTHVKKNSLNTNKTEKTKYKKTIKTTDNFKENRGKLNLQENGQELTNEQE